MASESLATSITPSVRIRSCSYQFEVDYSKSKDLPFEEYISSPIFTAGGYNWCLEYYPKGIDREDKGSHASLYLILKSEARNVTAEVSFYVLETTCRQLVPIFGEINTFEFRDDICGTEKFILRDDIEDLYCTDDIIVFSCHIRVLTKQNVAENFSTSLCERIQKCWENREGCDVSFEVEGESISAHKLILAARSPVFHAQLCGPLAEAKMEQIKVEEMKAEVFKALLDFIYTDELIIYETNNIERDDDTLSVELLQPLLAAADRYGLDKLTLLCEEMLERSLSVDTVASTLILADRHSRTSLRSKCLEFASDPENFSLMALAEDFFHITSTPTLFAELSEKIKSSCHHAKKQRTT